MAEEVGEQQQHGSEAKHPSPEENGGSAGGNPIPPPQHVYSSVSLNIWPPSQRTRDAVIHRLVETLSSPSFLSARYGLFTHEEASAAARLIEQEAFSAASASAPENRGHADSIDVGIEILQAYSKEISKRMIESAKARAASPSGPSPAESVVTVEMMTPPLAPPSAATGEEISSVESLAPVSCSPHP